jgi:hypothetical protein
MTPSALLADVHAFKRAVAALARQLRRNDPKLSADEALRRARELTKLDWDERSTECRPIH